MTDVAHEVKALRAAASQLDILSKQQTQISAALEPLELRFEQSLAKFERDLWNAHVYKGEKLPSERIRDAIHKGQIPATFLEELSSLKAQRIRVDREISNLKVGVDAHRSILSALKLEVEATI